MLCKPHSELKLPVELCLFDQAGERERRNVRCKAFSVVGKSVCEGSFVSSLLSIRPGRVWIAVSTLEELEGDDGFAQPQL